MPAAYRHTRPVRRRDGWHSEIGVNECVAPVFDGNVSIDPLQCVQDEVHSAVACDVRAHLPVGPMRRTHHVLDPFGREIHRAPMAASGSGTEERSAAYSGTESGV